MGFGTTLVSIVLILCATILFGLYMYYCVENEIKMFAYPRYEERIRKLEKEMSELKER